MRTVTVTLFVLLLMGCSSSEKSSPTDTTDQASDGQDIAGDLPPADVPVDLEGDARDLVADVPFDLPADTPDIGPDVVPPTPMDTYLYVAEADGDITVYLIGEDGGLTEQGSVSENGGLGFMAMGPNNDRVYATTGQRVDAFSVESGVVPTFLSSGDAGINGTHIAIGHSRQHAFVASYGGDAIAMLPLDPNGEPGDVSVTLGGSAAPSLCQNAHQVRVHPNNRIVYVPCLGSDHVAILGYDGAMGTLTPTGTGDTAGGAGPRHMDIHPTMDVAYVINELNSTIDVFSINAMDGALSPLQTISTVPMGSSASRSSDIHVSPDGRFVYGMNREPENSLAVFAVQPDGTLMATGHTSTSGDHARTFVVHPNGEWLFTGNSNSQDVTTFAVDSTSGALTQSGAPLGGFSDRVLTVEIRQVPRP